MKKLILLSCAAAACGAVLTGCRHIEVENYGVEIVRNADGSPVIATNGLAQTISKGWRVDHFQHWMMTDADAIEASVKPQEISVKLNGVKSRPDAEGLANVVDKSSSGAANLAAKIGAAIASAGAAPSAEAIAALVKRFTAAGGNPDKATVECTDGSCTISDGDITCTDGSCYDVN